MPRPRDAASTPGIDAKLRLFIYIYRFFMPTAETRPAFAAVGLVSDFWKLPD